MANWLDIGSFSYTSTSMMMLLQLYVTYIDAHVQMLRQGVSLLYVGDRFWKSRSAQSRNAPAATCCFELSSGTLQEIVGAPTRCKTQLTMSTSCAVARRHAILCSFLTRLHPFLLSFLAVPLSILTYPNLRSRHNSE